MNADYGGPPHLRRWRQSYRFLPFGAGPREIAKSSTSDLQAAHRLMAPCKVKPPGLQFHLATDRLLSLLSQGALFSYLENLVVDESWRYARVCRELATRTEPDNPELALALLRSSLLPESSSLAFESYDAYMSWWDRTKQHVDRLHGEFMKLAEEVLNPSGEAREYGNGYNRNLLLRWMVGSLDYAAYEGSLKAAFAVRQKQDAWNFGIKASMVALEQRLGRGEEAWKLKGECLDILRITADDDLWSSLIDRATDRSAIAVPATVPAAPSMAEVETVVARVLHSQLQPLLSSMHENLQIGHALQARMDFVVEKLIDLDQQSELTWQEIRR
ncbi:MAG TPA: hypothetical protein VFT91_10850, partial [Dehalococcoidia bacterium]|nr:hypothetical protein [Dehalococcoidia bacterium]